MGKYIRMPAAWALMAGVPARYFQRAGIKANTKRWITVVLAGVLLGVAARAPLAAPGDVIREFVEPDGVAGARFGSSVAAVDDTKFWVGAPGWQAQVAGYNGKAFLMNVDGKELARLENPTGLWGERFADFAQSMVVVGDYLVIGAPYAYTKAGTDLGTGAVHVFDKNTGQFVRTIFFPGVLVPAQYIVFGYPIVPINSTTALIGALGDGANDQGKVYVYNIETAELRAVIPPPYPPQNPDARSFGGAIAHMPGRLAISDYGQAVHLFTDDTFAWLGAIDPPGYSESYGSDVFFIGDKLVIGDFRRITATERGVAHILIRPYFFGH